MPILEGTDGVQKMSKSLGNYIGVNEEPNEIFGKTMSITDDLICRYFELVTRVPMSEINEMKTRMEKGELNPRDAKIKLAKAIIAIFYNEEEADKAEERFKLIFSKHDIPDDIPRYKPPKRKCGCRNFYLNMAWFSLPVMAEGCSSRRL
jgi:tyrosyl-tRNA synthetase